MTGRRRGRFIALEGIDGSGKSTQARLLAERTGAVLTREPGGTPLGERLRAVVLDREGPPMGARAEALLIAAARAQLVEEVIAPALAAGRDVVTDRFSGSTLAYQGHGRGLDVAELARISAWAAAGLEPDVVVLLDAPAVELVARAGPADRITDAGVAFLERVRRGYLELAASHPGWVVVDATGTPGEVAARVRAAVEGVGGGTPRR